MKHTTTHAQEGTMHTLSIGSLVEAEVIGTPGTFRVIEGHRPAQAGMVWLRETGLHVVAGYEPFVIEWAARECREVVA